MDLPGAKGDHLSVEACQFFLRLKCFQVFVLLVQDCRAGVKNTLAGIGRKQGKEGDPHLKLVFRVGLFFIELRQSINERASASGGERVDLAGLSTLSFCFSDLDLALPDEPFQQWIDEVVVQFALAEDERGALFQSVSMVRAAEQDRQDY